MPQVKDMMDNMVQHRKGIWGRFFSARMLLVIFLGFIAFVVYSNTIKNDYALDDVVAIVQNKMVVKGAAAIPEIMSSPYRRGYSKVQNDLYRPLSLVLFAVEYQIFGQDAEVGHLVNVLLYCGCVILLFLFLDRFFERKKTAIAFIAALIFAVHPIHTEVVANIKSGDELLCFFFAFLSLNIFLKYMRQGNIGLLLGGAVCFFLAMLSKESGVAIFGVIILTFFFYRNENRKRALYITACALIMVIAFLYVRYSVLNAYDTEYIANVSAIDNALAAHDILVSSRIATAMLILGMYLKLLFMPYPLICDYSYNTIPVVDFSNLWAIISVVIYLALVGYGIMSILKKRKDVFAFGILFFLIMIALVSNIPFLIGTTMGERLLFMGSVGFAVVVAFVIERLVIKDETGIKSLKKPKVLVIMVPLVLLFAGMTFARNRDWENNFTLYKADVEKASNSARLNFYLGLELGKMAINETDKQHANELRNEGIGYLTKSTEIMPDYADAQAALGTSYGFFSKFDSAEVHEKKAYDLYPQDEQTVNNLWLIYYNERKYQQSIEFAKKAIELNPAFINPYISMERCYLSLGKSDSAVYILHKAISLIGNSSYPYFELAQYYQSTGQADSTAKYSALAKRYRQ